MLDRQSWTTVDELIGLSAEEMREIDPVVMNLAVAKGVPALRDLDIGRYVVLADKWAADIERCLPGGEANFRRHPELWQNDIDFARLAVMCWYVDSVLGIQYREDQRNVGHRGILYTDPGDLFLNGVMETRRGTCGNMATLHVALGWRLGWPVSLACVRSHYICRFDDGTKTFNIEATVGGDGGGFSSPPDEHYVRAHSLSRKAIDCGSDLRAVTPREMLGLFIGLRARHLENTLRLSDAESDYLLARHLFPKNRCLYIAQNQISVQCSMDLFDPHEKGHPVELANWLQDVVRVAPWSQNTVRRDIYAHQDLKETSNARHVDAIIRGFAVANEGP
ncbi:MAG: transglutaminase family protein [Pirellulales bacterium]